MALNSPNYGMRRGFDYPIFIIIHGTWMDDFSQALDRLCEPKAEVSAHYAIAQHGETYRLVPEHLRAWHAGKSHWQGIDDINSASIGIELDNDGTSPYNARQIDSLIQLCSDLCLRYGLSSHQILGHSDIAPTRKDDPGVLFPWQTLKKGLEGL